MRLQNNLALTLPLLAALSLAASPASAEVVTACKGVFSSTVTIRDKAPNTTVWIWQSSEKMGIDGFVNTSFSVSTDANGNGTVEIPNTASGTLHTDYTVKTGTSSQSNADQAPKLVLRPWYLSSAAVTPGDTPDLGLCLYQKVVGPDGELLQTWNPGTVLQLSLNPAEAQWLPQGIHLQIQGDVQVAITNVTPNFIRLQIMGDPTPMSGDRIRIGGLGLRTFAPMGQSVGVRLAFQGSTNTFVDGQFFSADNFPVPIDYEYLRLPVVGPRIVEGAIHLEAFGPSLRPVQGTLEIRDPVTHVPIQIEPLHLMNSGAFYVPTNLPPGAYEVSIKCSNWLRETRLVNFSNIGATGLQFHVRTGDCDGDNEVAIGDYALISQAFLAETPDPNFIEGADLDGSGTVDIGDYSLMSWRYGSVGDD
ncbi:MAG TPA: dockerin type I repeat-containing protein [Fimbriimonadaceae bacterium]|nr:dockerin type I repeat-containing protein [Fimbriimonadaceae bacterium]HRJ97757.1 dockerin type I repeat-containing protein [Fimbriimonadaceae bacterium]